MRWKLFAALSLLALFPVLLLGLRIDAPPDAVTMEGAAVVSTQPAVLPGSPDYQFLIFKTKIGNMPPAPVLVQQTQPAPEQAPPAGPPQPAPGPGGGYGGWGWSWWWWVIIIIIIIFFIIIFGSGGRWGGRRGGPPPPDDRV